MTAGRMLARMARCWHGWPPHLAAEAQAYSRASRSSSAIEIASLDAELPYLWLLLPKWLALSTGVAGKRDGAHFLRDVSWAQFALFLFVRIHDDLVDRQARSPWLAYVGDRYLVESVSTYSRHVGPDFWPLFWELVTTTLDGIAEADRIQRSARPDRRALLAAYAQVSAIFKISSIAVLQRAGKMQLYPAVARFKDHTARAGQILDDIEDLDEDFAQGRRNYLAASLLSSHRGAGEPRDPRRLMVRRVVTGAFVDGCLEEADRQFAAAGRALTLEGVQRYVNGQRSRIERLRATFHARRVSLLLSET